MYGVGSLVLVHGYHVGIVLYHYKPNDIWLVRLLDGTELGLFDEDIEPLIIKEIEDDLRILHERGGDSPNKSKQKEVLWFTKLKHNN